MKFTAFISALAVFSISDQASAMQIEENSPELEFAQSEAYTFSELEADECRKTCQCCPGTYKEWCCAKNGGKGNRGKQGVQGTTG